MDIDGYLVSLEKIIINIDQCYGHRDDDHQETINEHIQLCTKYLKEIFKLKKLDSILKSFNISCISFFKISLSFNIKSVYLSLDNLI